MQKSASNTSISARKLTSNAWNPIKSVEQLKIWSDPFLPHPYSNANTPSTAFPENLKSSLAESNYLQSKPTAETSALKTLNTAKSEWRKKRHNNLDARQKIASRLQSSQTTVSVDSSLVHSTIAKVEGDLDYLLSIRHDLAGQGRKDKLTVETLDYLNCRLAKIKLKLLDEI